MFYSHELLSSSQYGVATIWLVATVGKGASRKVTRKAIQEVNVPKACETIIEPGAPLALRLQGSLLYGTARVFAQQCGYVLSDAEKTQSDMMTFFRVAYSSEIDPAAGKTQRQNIILPDDPSFDPFAAIPSLDILNTTSEFIFNYSQGSGARCSNFSPPNLSQLDSTPQNQSLLGGLDFRSSSHSMSTYNQLSGTGRKSAPYHHGLESDQASELNMFADELSQGEPISLEFDEFGNLVGIGENEPELPTLSGASDLHPLRTANRQHKDMPIIGDDGLLLLEEPQLPEAEAFAMKPPVMASEVLTTESVETSEATAKNTRKSRRKAKNVVALDQIDKVSRDEFKSWSQDYVERMGAKRREQGKTTIAKARINALAFISGNGVANVGNLHEFGGIVHPLASHFAGHALEASLQGRDPTYAKEEVRRGRRRSSAEAFEDEGGDDERRVKKKVEYEDEVGRDVLGNDDDVAMFGDDTGLEVGMEPMSAMAERHSSTVMPWSRPSSVVPGSSVRGRGSAQKVLPEQSPLLNRGRQLSDIERHSDSVAQPSDDLVQYHLSGPSPTPELLSDVLGDYQIDTDSGSVANLDIASQEFLGYVADCVTREAAEEKVGLHEGERQKHWVDFRQLADPSIHTRAVAAQAFLHVLSLATKNVLAVEQDGAAGFIPFGSIRVGVSSKLVEEYEGAGVVQHD